MKSFKVLLVILMMSSTLFSCVSRRISPDERLALKRVSIASITLPEKPVVFSPGSGAAFVIAGPLGVALANGSSDVPTAYKQLLAQNKIDVPSIIRAELKAQLKLKDIDVVENEKQADAVLRVEVLQYGLTGDIFSGKRFPQLWAKFRLTKPNGSVIWKNMGAAHITKDITKQVEARPIPDFFNDPKFLESQINKITQIVVGSAASTL